MNHRNRNLFTVRFWREKGQSIVEYTVVSASLLLVAAGPGADYVADLTDAVRDNYRAYSYAVSLSDFPDKEDLDDLNDMYVDQGMPYDYKEYLTDNPSDLIEDLKNYAMDALPPEISEGIDVLDGFGLSLDDFCSFCTGNPFDAL